MEIWQLTDVQKTHTSRRWEYSFLFIGDRENRYENSQMDCGSWNFNETESRFVISLKKDT